MELVFGIVGTITGVVGIIFGFLGWKRAGEALKETRRDPVRLEQHRILSERSGQLRDLVELLERVNSDVQVDPQPETLREHVSKLASLVDTLTAEPRIVDPELWQRLTGIRDVIAPQGDPDRGLSWQLDLYATTCEEVGKAKRRPGDSQGIRDALVSLGERRARLHDRTRDTNREALESVRRALDRVRHLEAEGFGDFPSPGRTVGGGV